jgi:hypothetical protein
MTTHHVSGPDHASAPSPTPANPWRSFAEWLAVILGGVAVFMGAFILLADGDQSVGFWGDASWQVNEISAWWGIGLIVAGLVALALVFTSVWSRKH